MNRLCGQKRVEVKKVLKNLLMRSPSGCFTTDSEGVKGKPFLCGVYVKCMTFVVFEGIDGSGKRTLCEYARRLLEEKGIHVKQYQYPDYESPWGKIIEDFLSKKRELDVLIQFLTYATDIVKDQKEIREYLKKGDTILADRYITSTVAFQCARRFDIKKAVQFVDMFEFIPPDIIFYMNVSPETGRQRKKGQKGDLDRHEADLKFLEKVNALYKQLCNQSFLARKWVEVDANKELPLIKEIIKTELI
ncbi:MAG: dTMP kinase [Theionarchaea archaeon]|nr:dTMP kinase [Theionarchaea archaeon]